MKVMVETNLDFGWKVKNGEVQLGNHPPPIITLYQEGEVELGNAQPTVRTLLQKLSSEYSNGKVSFIDPESDTVDPDEYLVMINGRNLEFIARGLETELYDGDRVSITMWLELLGGG